MELGNAAGDAKWWCAKDRSECPRDSNRSVPRSSTSPNRMYSTTAAARITYTIVNKRSAASDGSSDSAELSITIIILSCAPLVTMGRLYSKKNTLYLSWEDQPDLDFGPYWLHMEAMRKGRAVGKPGGPQN